MRLFTLTLVLLSTISGTASAEVLGVLDGWTLERAGVQCTLSIKMRDGTTAGVAANSYSGSFTVFAISSNWHSLVVGQAYQLGVSLGGRNFPGGGASIAGLSQDGRKWLAKDISPDFVSTAFEHQLPIRLRYKDALLAEFWASSKVAYSRLSQCAQGNPDPADPFSR